jgi:hypothetical protein
MTVVILCNIIFAGLVLAITVGGLMATILTQKPSHNQTRHERVAAPILMTSEPTRA